jgi:magnesium-transporting ATPase (P-type)
MKFKQFLKPDWRKIVVFAIIFIVFSFVPIWTTIRCSTWECGPGPTTSSFFDSLESMANKEFFDFGYFTPWISIFFVSIAISYLLSYLIVWIYDKVKKKK